MQVTYGQIVKKDNRMKYLNLQQFWEQLRKNRFFTFLSLFGMSIPVMVIMIMVLKVEMSINPGGPEKNNDEMLFIRQVKINGKDGAEAWGGVPLNIIEDHFRPLAAPNSLAFSATGSATFFKNSQARDLSLRYANADFWKVFDFRFFHGHPFNEKDVEEKHNVAVISGSLARKLFGKKDALGTTMAINGEVYRITGVVEAVGSLSRNTYAQIWLPYTRRNNSPVNADYSHTGAYDVTFRSTENWTEEQIQQQVGQVNERLNNLNGDQELIFAGPAPADEIYFRGYRDPEEYGGLWMSYLGMAGKALLILFLPALNLVSINMTRIQERSQEIAIRKAFGATRRNLALQVMAENIVLTFLGGVMGLIMAYAVATGFKEQVFTAWFINNPSEVSLQLNYGVFFILIGVSLIFSVLSGLIPAMRISRLQPAYVLKGGVL
jgi:putative ABC transport system permease protein